MLKVMLIEDEDIVREDIKRLINWEKHGYIITAEARNGEDGLRGIAECNPDIIITDIKMPGMGGLEMVSRLSAVRNNKKIILLTSYRDFNYARQAIEYGINSYILKHELDEPILLHELGKLKRQIETEHRQNYLARIETIKRYFNQAALHADARDALDAGGPLPWQGRTGILILGPDDASDPKLPAPGGRGIDKYQMLHFLYETPFADLKAEAMDLPADRYALFLKIPSHYSKKNAFDFLYAAARTVQTELEHRLHTKASLAIGPTFETSREITGCLQEAELTFAMKMFRKSGSIVTDRPRPSADKSQREAVAKQLAAIRTNLDEQEYFQVKQGIDRLFQELLPTLQDLELLRSSTHELVRLLDQERGSRQPAAWDGMLQRMAEVKKLDNVYAMSDWFKSQVDDFHEKSDRKISKKVKGLLQYIHENYCKDITLPEIADRLETSIIYASVLFKKEVGVSFITYVNHYRIQRAKELLETGQYKVYEVSCLVGYQTVQYFSRMFRKMTGQSPSDFLSGER